MQFGLSLPVHGTFADVHTLVSLAKLAERTGWHGFFIWDHIAWQDFGKQKPVVDPWITLAAIAATTEQIRIGPLVTPLARRRPWKVARESVTLDHLSNGRLVLGVGLGAFSKAEFEVFGDEADPKIRAQQLDEALDVLTGLWQGEPFSYHGSHYDVEQAHFMPQARQSPRIPIWGAGTWRYNQKRRPFRRAARLDGIFPFVVKRETVVDAEGVEKEILRREMLPEDIHVIRNYIMQHQPPELEGADHPFDILCERPFSQEGLGSREIIQPYAEAGVTWWIVTPSNTQHTIDEVVALIEQGPPSM